MSLSLSSRARLNLPVSGAEISAWSTSAQVLLTIGGSNQLAIVSLADPSKPALVSTTALAGPANSVAVNSAGLVAVAVEGQGSARYTGGRFSCSGCRARVRPRRWCRPGRSPWAPCLTR